MTIRFRWLWLALVAGDALAWRCDVWLIEPGLPQYEVAQKCGDPVNAEQRTEWRVQTIFQPQCQTVYEPVTAPAPGPSGRPGGAAGTAAPTVVPRTFCTSIPVNITIPVDVQIWYYDDASVPKALHFENGRLAFIETLWGLRHPH